MLEVSSWWAEQAKASTSEPIRRLRVYTANSVYDLSHHVSKWPTITRKIGDLKPAKASFDLARSDFSGELAYLMDRWDPSGGLTLFYPGTRWEVSVGYHHPSSGEENYPVFVGRMRSRKRRAGKVRVNLEGHEHILNDKKVGGKLDGYLPESGGRVDIGFSITAMDSTYDPARVFWTLCTCYGGMDPVEASANSQINYDEFAGWWATMSNYLWGARVGVALEGQPLATHLTEIAKQTHSMIGLQQDGRLLVRRRNGLDEGDGGHAYQPDGELTGDIILEGEYEDGLNFPTRVRATVYTIWGEGYVEAWENISEQFYGERKEQWESPTFTHRYIAGGPHWNYFDGSTALLNITQAIPDGLERPRVGSVKTNLWGMLYDPANIVQITDSVNDISSVWWNITEQKVNVDKLEVGFKVEERWELQYPSRASENYATSGGAGSPYRLGQLADVELTATASGDVIQYDGSSYWENQALVSRPTPMHMSTSGGVGGFSFPGQYCEYIEVEYIGVTFTSTETGDLGQYQEGAGINPNSAGGYSKVLTRKDNNRWPAGVFLEAGNSGDILKLAIRGCVDAKTYSSRTAVGDYVQAGDQVGSYHGVAYGGATRQVGISRSKMGTGGYVAGWVRLDLIPQAR